MDSYTGFASVYDTFMDNVPYEEWAEYLIELLKDAGITEGIVADLGCGTGTLTRMLSQKGFDMIGIDNSIEMLDIAKKRGQGDLEATGMVEAKEGASNILYLCQDMREFELYGTVSAIVSICDSINYITDDEDLKKVFGLVNNYLDYDGVFIFDLNTKYKYEHILSDNVFAENRDDCSFIWENYYDEETNINEYDLTLYISKRRLNNVDVSIDNAESESCGSCEVSGICKDYGSLGEEDSYLRFEEFHEQKAYETENVIKYLKEAGLCVDHIYDAFTKEEPRFDSERIYIVAHRPRK